MMIIMMMMMMMIPMENDDGSNNDDDNDVDNYNDTDTLKYECKEVSRFPALVDEDGFVCVIRKVDHQLRLLYQPFQKWDKDLILKFIWSNMMMGVGAKTFKTKSCLCSFYTKSRSGFNIGALPEYPKLGPNGIMETINFGVHLRRFCQFEKVRY